NAERAERGRDTPARGAHVARALQHGREPASLGAVQERLWKRPDDRGDGVGGSPVVQVPPDPVALVDGRAGRPLRRLDAVDVVEPVAARGATRESVDRLDEPAAVSQLDVEVTLE